MRGSLARWPGQALAARWPSADPVLCELCDAPVWAGPRPQDVIGALLGDVDPGPVWPDCLFCSQEAMERAEGWPAVRHR